MEPYAYVARPYWDRDDDCVAPSLAMLPQACSGETWTDPDSFAVHALYADGTERKLAREEYSRPNPPTEQEARTFVETRRRHLEESERRHGAKDSILKLQGAFRANYDDPVDKQIADYIASAPWVWAVGDDTDPK